MDTASSHRALDLRAHRRGAVEIARQEDCFEQRRDLIIVVAQHRAQLLLKLGRRILAHKVAIDLARDKIRRGGLLQDDVDDVDAVEAAGLAEKRLFAVVVLIFVDDEFEIHVVPAGEGARRLANVLLRVVADAHGEHLHDFAREVFVGGALHVDARVQERQHRRVLGHGHHQVPEIAGAVVLEEFQLVEKLAIIADFGFVDGEMAVPEQRHVFLQRLRAGEHAICPPIADAVGFERAGAQPIEKFVDHGLQPAVARQASL